MIHPTRIALDDSKPYDERCKAACLTFGFPRNASCLHEYSQFDTEMQDEGPPLRCSWCIVDANGVPTLCKREATGTQLSTPPMTAELVLRRICSSPKCPPDMCHLGDAAADVLLGECDVVAAADFVQGKLGVVSPVTDLWAQVPDTLIFLCPDHRRCIKVCEVCEGFFGDTTGSATTCFSCTSPVGSESNGESDCESDDQSVQPALKKRKLNNE